MNEYIKIMPLKNPYLKKCECCDKVQDVYFKALIFSNESKELLMGEINMCKACGVNFNKIIGNKDEIGSKVVKEFKFGK